MTAPDSNAAAVFARLIARATNLARAMAEARQLERARRWRSARLVWPLFTGDA